MPLSDNGANTLSEASQREWQNDCYGSKTEAAGTAITRVIPGREGTRAVVLSFSYLPGATAHTITMMPAVASRKMTQNADAGQAVINVDSIPTNPDNGTALASGDLIVVTHFDGTVEDYAYSSHSGNAITLTGNLDKAVLEGSRVHFHWAAADHAERQFLTVASVEFGRYGGDERHRFCTARYNDSPIIVHSDNGTNAGNLKHVAFGYLTNP